MIDLDRSEPLSFVDGTPGLTEAFSEVRDSPDGAGGGKAVRRSLLVELPLDLLNPLFAHGFAHVAEHASEVEVASVHPPAKTTETVRPYVVRDAVAIAEGLCLEREYRARARGAAFNFNVDPFTALAGLPAIIDARFFADVEEVAPFGRPRVVHEPIHRLPEALCNGVLVFPQARDVEPRKTGRNHLVRALDELPSKGWMCR